MDAIMADYLYKNFLNDKRVYNLAQSFWRRQLENLLKPYGYSHRPYLNTIQNNGQKEYDGNPIFNAYIPEISRAIRIIQVSPDEEGDEISAWLDEIEMERKTVKELVIDVKLSKQTRSVVQALLERWLAENMTESTLNQFLKMGT